MEAFADGAENTVLAWTQPLDFADWGSSIGILSADERARADRFFRERDRARYVCARAFLRRVLGACLHRAPDELGFAYGPNGRPRLAEPAVDLDFNLSHAASMVMLAVSRCGPIGVDIEVVHDGWDLRSMAQQILHPQEVAGFSELAGADQTAAFFALWTRKEAALKALGTGLSLDPRTLRLGLANEGATTTVEVHGTMCAVGNVASPAGYVAAICAPAAAALNWQMGAVVCERE